jgi:hypothetical protein
LISTPNQKEDVTSLIIMSKVFTTALSVVPFTAPVAPAPPNLFQKWSEVATSLGFVVSDYQAVVSNSIKATLDAKIGDPAGILSVLAGGEFLGVARNIT